MNQSRQKDILRWSPVAILLLLALVAPLFGDSTVAVVTPLLLAIVLAGANVVQQQKNKQQSRAGR